MNENLNKNRYDVIVIGGGAAGMMAAGTAAEQGKRVLLIEKNNIMGKKLLITGKGRCNLTNACDDVEDLINNVTVNSSFLYSAFYGFTNHDTIEFFNGFGVETKIERGKRVFPASDKSSDVVGALVRYMKMYGVRIVHDRVSEILCNDDGAVCGVLTSKGSCLCTESVIVATGGLSYQKTGSTGDGYIWAEKLGHTLVDRKPSLVPIEVGEQWAYGLMGVSLRNISITVFNEKNKKIYQDFGEMMFAHFGLSGPVILSASAHMRPMVEGKYRVCIDLKPGLDEQTLDRRILKDFQKYSNKDFVNSLKDLIPIGLIDVITELSGIEPHKKVNSVTREERSGLVRLIKRLELTVTGFCPIERAIITSGGVAVREIDPSTMQSKKVRGLYFAGEIIDVDAYTGGYNLQIAFSTGRLAGINC